MDDLWVFGYGSLMWNPGFDAAEQSAATVFGYRRALCIHSHVHRGTAERPGLVLGLDRGGSCRGMSFRIAPDQHEPVLAYLRERELVTHVYKERVLPLRLSDGRTVRSIAYVVDRHHAQYAGALSADEAAVIVAQARGRSGENIDYVLNTLDHLRAMGIRDQWLEEVGRGVKALRARD
jgi:cation transport protein ChaC